MKNQVKYSAEALLKSKALSHYQQDFARAILAGKEYTVREAKATLDKFLQGSVK